MKVFNFLAFLSFEKSEKSGKTRKLSAGELEDKAAKFAIKNVCKNCKFGCKKVDSLCRCVRYYMDAFMDGYRDCENRGEE